MSFNKTQKHICFINLIKFERNGNGSISELNNLIWTLIDRIGISLDGKLLNGN